MNYVELVIKTEDNLVSLYDFLNSIGCDYEIIKEWFDE